MIAFPGMLVKPAEEAGMKVPKDPDEYNSSDYPHWHVFLFSQLGSPMPFSDSHWKNAKVIASISNDKIKKIFIEDIIQLGFEYGS